MLYYVVDSVDATAEMQTCANNETAHILPICSKVRILLQSHTYKQSLTNFIMPINLKLLYIYGAN